MKIGTIENPITFDSPKVTDRDGKWCRCTKCRKIAQHTQNYPFHTDEAHTYLKCDTCKVGAHDITVRMMMSSQPTTFTSN